MNCMQGFIVLSCLIAVSVNFSTFLVIGTTSPVTYQVLGHLKTCLVLSFGYTLLHDPFTLRNALGILIAIFGMALYSYFSVREGKKKSANDALPVSQVLFFSNPWITCIMGLIGWLPKYAQTKIWQAMIMAIIWFATKTCQLLTFGLPNLWQIFTKLWLAKSSAWQILVANQSGPIIHIYLFQKK